MKFKAKEVEKSNFNYCKSCFERKPKKPYERKYQIQVHPFLQIMHEEYAVIHSLSNNYGGSREIQVSSFETVGNERKQRRFCIGERCTQFWKRRQKPSPFP